MLLNTLKYKLKSQKGAIDKVLVTLLLVVVGVAALIGLEQWTSNHKEDIMNQSSTTITNIINE